MTSTETLTASDRTVADAYADDGFVFPFDILDAEETSALRSDLESAEADLADDAEKFALLRSYPDRLLPSFDALIRNPKLVDLAQQILGPDLMVWSSGLFIKEAHSTQIVSWHQDLTYWGLDDAEEITCWVALSPATIESGCMRFVPGSHKQQAVAHTDTFHENNLLTRGQEIAVEVNEEDGIDVQLMPGQASVHHGHLFHASGPNVSDDRRIAVAIRYIKPSMKQKSGDKTLVAMIQGEDRFGHFKIAGAPKGRLLDEDFDLSRQDSAIKRQVLYEGAEDVAGTRY
jgi:chlorinating enzyme